MDWKNRLEQIRNKLKLQLHAKGVDNLLQLKKIFDVSISEFTRLGLRFRPLRHPGQARVRGDVLQTWCLHDHPGAHLRLQLV